MTSVMADVSPSEMVTNSSRSPWWIDVVVAVVSLSFAASQFITDRIMSAFDSGVYFGAASQFVAGHLPYRDFVFVQPPGALVLLSPWALIGQLTSTSIGFTLARGCSAVVVAALAVLISRLLRTYGAMAALVGGLAVALAPIAAFEMTAVKLEPYCLLLSLAGACAVMRAEHRDPRGASRLIASAGFALGVAGAVKLWALLIFVALAVCVWRIGRQFMVRFAAWAMGGFVVFAGPFFLFAPSQFITQVFTVQLFRSHNALGAVTTVNRLSQITGLRNTPLALNGVEIFMFYGVIAVLALLGLLLGGRRRLCDDFFLVASALTLVALLVSKEFYNYYGYFLVPLLVGQSVASVFQIKRGLIARRDSMSGPASPHLVTVTSRVVLVLLLGGAVIASAVGGHSLIEVDAGANQPTLIDHYIPSGSCVIFDDAIQGVLASRLVSASPSCPVIVDAGGLSMAVGGVHPLRSLALTQLWRRDFLAAQYVVLAGLTPLGIPWSGTLYSWFVQHFHVVFNGINYVIFRHD